MSRDDVGKSIVFKWFLTRTGSLLTGSPEPFVRFAKAAMVWRK
jgi:hypothetical protein